MLGATHDETEPLGCGLAGGNDDFGCSCSLPYLNDSGGGAVGGLGTCVCATDVGTCVCAPVGMMIGAAALLVATCMLIALRNGTSQFRALSFAVNKWTVSNELVASICWMILCRVDIPLPSRPIPQLVQKHQHNPL